MPPIILASLVMLYDLESVPKELLFIAYFHGYTDYCNLGIFETNKAV